MSISEILLQTSKTLPKNWHMEVCKRMREKKIKITSEVIKDAILKGEQPVHWMEIIEEYKNYCKEIKTQKDAAINELTEVLN